MITINIGLTIAIALANKNDIILYSDNILIEKIVRDPRKIANVRSLRNIRPAPSLTLKVFSQR